MLRLQLLGGCSLACGGEEQSGPAAQPRRLALFALAASVRSAGISRDKLTAYFWPDEDREHARHYLADSLFTIKKACGREIFLITASGIRLNPSLVTSDLWDFEDAISAGNHAEAVACYRGDFLDGFFVSDAPEFERWVDGERDRLRKMCGTAIETLARRSEEAANYPDAAQWWLRLSAHDPYSSRVAARVMLSLEKAGDIASAVQHAVKHERTLREDLDISPAAEVMDIADRLRSRSSRLPPARSAAQSAATSQAPAATPPGELAAPVIPLAASPEKRVSDWRFSISLLLVSGIVTLIAANGLAPRRQIGSFEISSFLSRARSDSAAIHDARGQAEELYHRARLTAISGSPPGPIEEPLALYRRVLQIDPAFALAYAGIADLYSAHGRYDLAKGEALKALALDSTLAEGHTALAAALGYGEHRWWAADSALDRAIRLSPRNKLAWMRRAYIAAMQGRADDALNYLYKARDLEPESWITLFNVAVIEAHVGRLDDALMHFQEVIQLDPTRKDARTLYGRALWKAGRRADAIAMFRSSGAVVEAAVAASDTAEMKALIRRYRGGDLDVDYCEAAILYVGLGDRDAAFRELRKTRKVWLPRLLKEPPLVWLSSDRRYGELLAEWRLGEPAHR